MAQEFKATLKAEVDKEVQKILEEYKDIEQKWKKLEEWEKSQMKKFELMTLKQ